MELRNVPVPRESRPVTDARMTSRIVRCRSVRPVAPRGAGVLPGAPVLSFMAVDLAGIARIIKHVFERVGRYFDAAPVGRLPRR